MVGSAARQRAWGTLQRDEKSQSPVKSRKGQNWPIPGQPVPARLPNKHTNKLTSTCEPIWGVSAVASNMTTILTTAFVIFDLEGGKILCR